MEYMHKIIDEKTDDTRRSHICNATFCTITFTPSISLKKNKYKNTDELSSKHINNNLTIIHYRRK